MDHSTSSATGRLLGMSVSSQRPECLSPGSSKSLARAQVMESAVRKQLMHKYTHDQRLILCLIKKFFEADAAQTTRIFNLIFRNILQESGLWDGLPQRRIVSQLHELENLRGPYAKYSHILEGSFREVRQRYQEARGSIEDAAIDLGITLTLRINAGAGCRHPAARIGRKSYQTLRASPLMEEHSDDGLSTGDEHLRPRKLRRTKSTRDQSSPILVQIPPLPGAASVSASSARPTIDHEQYWQHIVQGHRALLMRNKDQDGKRIPRQPVLLFRHWTPSSGLRARLQLPTPPEGDDLIRYCKQHLDIKQHSSPFMSCSQFLIPVLHRAMVAHRENKQSEGKISIIWYDVLVKSLNKKYPGDQDVVHLVPTLCTNLQIKGREYYTGRGEFLVFNEVPEEAIVCSISVSDLWNARECKSPLSRLLQLDLITQQPRARGLGQKLVKTATAMDREAGQVLGDFLDQLSINGQSRETVALAIAGAIRLQRYRSRSRRVYLSFMSGVFGIGADALRAATPAASSDESEEDITAIDHDSDDEFVDQHSQLERKHTPPPFSESDEEQYLLDQQLAATNAEFNSDSPSLVARRAPPSQKSTWHQERLNRTDGFAVVNLPISLSTPPTTIIRSFSAELLEIAQNSTPTPTPAPGPEPRPSQVTATRSTATTVDIIDLTIGEDDMKDEGRQLEITMAEDVDDDDLILLDIVSRQSSVLSIRTRSIEPAVAATTTTAIARRR